MNISKKIDFPLVTALIAILPIYGYFIAYVFESTYLGLLGIPSDFVQIRLNSIFLISVIVILLSTFILYLAFFFRPLLKKHKNNFLLYPIIFYGLLLSVIAGITYIFMPNFIKNVTPVIAICSVLFVLNEFMYPLLKYKTFKNYKEHVIELRNTKTNSDKSQLNSDNAYLNLGLFSLVILVATYGIVIAFAGAYIVNFNTYLTFEKNGIKYALLRNENNEKIAIEYKNDRLIPGKILIFTSDSLGLVSRKLKLEEVSRRKLFPLIRD
ncbi:MAG: hypothetical protein AAB521_00250 [Patescibacteria group bacterium]